MQYRTGNNYSEPTKNDTRSRAWLFILRDTTLPKFPEYFSPHINFVAWIATRYNDYSSHWLVRGYCQWTNPRNYHTLKTRYSKDAEWIPVDLKDVRIFNQHVSDPLPSRSYRFVLGKPFGVFPPHKTIPLHKVGLNIDVPDLVYEYNMARSLAEWEKEQLYAYDDDPPSPEPQAFVPPPPALPRPDEEFWVDMPDGSRSFLARWINGEISFDPP